MKLKTISKIIIDWLMIVLLMAQMGCHSWGNAAHEWIGVGMFVLFIVDHVLNVNGYKTVFKGKYTPYRSMQKPLSAQRKRITTVTTLMKSRIITSLRAI